MSDEVRTVHWDDIGYTTLYRLARPGSLIVSFECYRVTGWEGAEGGPPRWYGGGDGPVVGEAEGALTWEDARVRPHLHGDVKWDGCSDWSFPEQIEEDTMLHFCGRGYALATAVLLDRCYNLALEVMGPAVSDPDLFEGGRVAVRLEVVER